MTWFIIVFLVAFYQMEETNASCAHINGGCEDICTALPIGRVRCSCNPQGTLQADSKTCKYEESFIYGHADYLEFSKWKYRIRPNTLFHGLAQDYSNKRVFYSSYNSTASASTIGIIRVRARNAYTTITAVPGIIHSISYDHISDTLYYASWYSNTSGIIGSITNAAASNQVSTVLTKLPDAYAIEYEHWFGYLFVANGNRVVRIDTKKRSAIIIVDKIRLAFLVTVDKITEKVFWIDAGGTTGISRIEVANYDGSCRRVISVQIVEVPFGLMFWKGDLLWTTAARVYQTSVRTGRTVIMKQLTNRIFEIDYFGDAEELNGEWSSWIDTSSCQSNCQGNKTQTRHCKNRYLQHYRCLKTTLKKPLECLGESGFQTQNQTRMSSCITSSCPVEIDGQWSSWSAYGACSQTCGTGSKQRSRVCNNPAPAHGGKNCQGKNNETTTCIVKQCPAMVNGQWSSWSSYGACSQTCGTGSKQRSRVCNNPAPAHGGKNCQGKNNETTICIVKQCPAMVNGQWSLWSSYGACSQTCGTGTKQRSRVCNNPSPAHGGRQCLGNSTENVECVVQQCSETCSVNNGGCEDTCEELFRRASCKCNLLGVLNPDKRTCTYQSSFYVAHGDRLEFFQPTIKNSPPSIAFLNNKINLTFHVVTHNYRNKSILYVSPFNSQYVMVRTNLAGLKSTLMYTSRRQIISMIYDPDTTFLYLGYSVGNVEVIKNLDASPKSMYLTTAMKPTDFAVESCFGYLFIADAGQKSIIKYDRRLNKRTTIVDSKLVQLTAITIDKVTEKLFWADATLDVLEMANYDGSCRRTIVQLYKKHPSGIIFYSGTIMWVDQIKDDYKIYNTSIATGKTTIFSRLLFKPTVIDYFGTNIPPKQGHWSSWVDISNCPQSCVGTLRRRRTCLNPLLLHYNTTCIKTQCVSPFQCLDEHGTLKSTQTETVACSFPCKVNGGWGVWGSYGACSKTCGVGMKKRSRLCNNPPPSSGGLQCSGENSDERKCTLVSCKVDGGWSSWTSYSSCSKTCGEGSKTKTRACNNPTPSNGGSGCKGSNSNTTDCSQNTCSDPNLQNQSDDAADDEKNGTSMTLVGIGVGAVLILILIAIALFVFFLKYKRKPKERAPSEMDHYSPAVIPNDHAILQEHFFYDPRRAMAENQ